MIAIAGADPAKCGDNYGFVNGVLEGVVLDYWGPVFVGGIKSDGAAGGGALEGCYSGAGWTEGDFGGCGVGV